jgi:hypothetical protein
MNGPIEARVIDPETGEVVGRNDEVASERSPKNPSNGESSPARPDDNTALPAIVEPHTYRPQLVLAPEDASLLVEQVKAMQRSVLVSGTDYDTIPGTGKPSLLKPGAERLLQVFGLGHRMDVLDVDEDGDGRRVGVTYRCTVTKVLADGREITVSSCDGHASHEEPKWKKAPWNTVIKMAQKRALVGATLTATATSGLFTQDMEDMPRQERQRPQRQHNTGASAGDGITEQQVKLVLVLFGKLGIEDRATRLAECEVALGRKVESTKSLTRAEASTLIDYLKQEAGEE